MMHMTVQWEQRGYTTLCVLFVETLTIRRSRIHQYTQPFPAASTQHPAINNRAFDLFSQAKLLLTCLHVLLPYPTTVSRQDPKNLYSDGNVRKQPVSGCAYPLQPVAIAPVRTQCPNRTCRLYPTSLHRSCSTQAGRLYCTYSYCMLRQLTDYTVMRIGPTYFPLLLLTLGIKS